MNNKKVRYDGNESNKTKTKYKGKYYKPNQKKVFVVHFLPSYRYNPFVYHDKQATKKFR